MRLDDYATISYYFASHLQGRTYREYRHDAVYRKPVRLDGFRLLWPFLSPTNVEARTAQRRRRIRNRARELRALHPRDYCAIHAQQRLCRDTSAG